MHIDSEIKAINDCVKGIQGQEPIPITGLWFCSNATGGRVIVLIEVDGEWYEVAAMKGDGQGPISHCIHPSGLRGAMECGRPNEIH